MSANQGSAGQHELPVGYRLHWYEIASVLGVGGFGITYLAHDGNLKRQVAVKEFLPNELSVRKPDATVEPVSEEEAPTYQWGLARFLSEARTLAQFQHPNIVRVHSVFEANNTAYMVMDYESGESLASAFRRAEMRAESALVPLLLGLMDGLEEVHEAGFIHRDLKPGNIFVRADFSPVMLDFGSARQALGVETRTLTSLVSPGYAPFEQYNASREGDKQGPWTDIYALGATMYRAITGKGPVDALTRAGAILRGHKDVLVPATVLGEGRYSRWFLEAIDRALAFQPEGRPQSIGEWREMFGAAGAAHGTPGAGAGAEPATDSPATSLATMPGGGGGGEIDQTVRLGSGAQGSASGAHGSARRPIPEDAPRRAPTLIVGALIAAALLGGGAWWWLTRDGASLDVAPIAALASEVPCAVLAVERRIGSVTISGYAGAPGATAALVETVSALPGVERVDARIAQVDAAYCGVLEFYAPYLAANRDERLGARIATASGAGTLVGGEPLVLEVTAPLFTSHLYVDYYFHDRSVVHLTPSVQSSSQRADAGAAITLGDDGQWIVSPPFGTEMIVVLASREPLFDTPRRAQEPGTEYLSALARALEGTSAGGAAPGAAADLIVITTKGSE